MAERKLILEKCGTVDPLDIESSLGAGAYEGLKKALSLTPHGIQAEVERSGLRGRGGAGFPVSLKWREFRRADPRESCIICNGVAGDRQAEGNRLLLGGDPHSVIEGMIIAACASGARSGYLYCPAENDLGKTLETALVQARERGFLGGTAPGFDIELVTGPADFIVGEETVLISSMESGRAVARPKPPYPAERGFRGMPTLVHNPETLANLPPIIRQGAGWFRSLGTPGDPGTRVLTLAEGVKRSGAVEVEHGTPLREIVFEIGGGVAGSKRFKAMQLGGPTGGLIPEHLLDMPLDSDSLKEAGQIMGSGSVRVITGDALLVEAVRDAIARSAAASCGLCVPCRFGLKVLQNFLERVLKGEGSEDDLFRLEEMSCHIRDTSLCGLGRLAPLPVLSSLTHFRSDYSARIKDRPVAVSAQ